MKWTNAQRKYSNSSKGKASRLKYQTSEKGRAARAAYMARRKAKLAGKEQVGTIAPVKNKAEIVKIKQAP